MMMAAMMMFVMGVLLDMLGVTWVRLNEMMTHDEFLYVLRHIVRYIS